MHELGIANSVLEAVRAEATRHHGMRPRRVGLRLGDWCGVDPESLRFCFEALVAASDLDGLALHIERTHRRNHCPRCARDFPVTDFQSACPDCGALDTQVVAGHELELAYVELEEP